MKSSSPGFRRALLAGTCLAGSIAAAPGGADIYGFVDKNGHTHFSNYPVDHRYYLFKKERTNSSALPGSNSVFYNVYQPAPRRTIHVNPLQRKQYLPLVTAAAKEHHLSAALLNAVITVESGYNPKARSKKGAAGLMQLMPDTAKRYSVKDIWDPAQNIDGGARYLRDLLVLFKDDVSLALAAYNAGEGAVIQAGNRIPPYPETRSYVPRVLQHYYLYADAGTLR